MKSVAVLMVAAMIMLLAHEVQVTKAVTCSVTELAPCFDAVTKSQPPSAECCNKLKEQKPCLCGYIRDPTLNQYVNSPAATKTATACGVTIHC